MAKVNRALQRLFTSGRLEGAGVSFQVLSGACLTLHVEIPSFYEFQEDLEIFDVRHVEECLPSSRWNEEPDRDRLELWRRYVAEDLGLSAVSANDELHVVCAAMNPLVVKGLLPHEHKIAGVMVAAYLWALREGSGLNHAINMIKSAADLKYGADRVGYRAFLKRHYQEDHGRLSDRAAEYIEREFLDPRLAEAMDCRLRHRVFVQYLYRRVRFLDNFVPYQQNTARVATSYNELTGQPETVDTTHLGSTLMDQMLREVQRFSDPEILLDERHVQLIYQYAHGDGAIRVLGFHPPSMNHETRKDFEKLGFEILTGQYSRNELAVFVAWSMELEPEEVISILDRERYVLTKEYAGKMININERLVSRLPTIMCGERGVGKTELLRVFSLLVNIKTSKQFLGQVRADVRDFLTTYLTEQFENTDEASAIDAWKDIHFDQAHVQEEEDRLPIAQFTDELVEKVKEFFRSRFGSKDHRIWPVLRERLLDMSQRFAFLKLEDRILRQMQTHPEEFDDRLEVTLSQLELALRLKSRPLFFREAVHGKLTNEMVVKRMMAYNEIARQVGEEARRLGPKVPLPILTVFFTDLDTAPDPGIFKEIMLDGRCGSMGMEPNIFYAAATNPLRKASEVVKSANDVAHFMGLSKPLREPEEGAGSSDDMFSGHAWDGSDVVRLRITHASLNKCCWTFGSLSPVMMEQYLLFKLNLELRHQKHKKELVHDARVALDAVDDMLEASYGVREFLVHLALAVRSRSRAFLGIDDCADHSDLDRLVTLWMWLYVTAPTLCADCGCDTCRRRSIDIAADSDGASMTRSMLLAVALLYYVRLLPGSDLGGSIAGPDDVRGRIELESALGPYLRRCETSLLDQSEEYESLGSLLKREAAFFMQHMDVSGSVVPEEDLSESLFAAFVCLVNRIPLVVGDAGRGRRVMSSCMAVLSTNMRGPHSPSKFLQSLPAVQQLRHEARHESTSTEIDHFFEGATDASLRRDQDQDLIVAPMDGLGLLHPCGEPIAALLRHLCSHRDGRIACIVACDGLSTAAALLHVGVTVRST